MSSSNEDVRFALETETVTKKHNFFRKLGRSRLITTTAFLLLLLLLLIFILLFISKGVECPNTLAPIADEIVSMATKALQLQDDDISNVWTQLRLPRSLLPSHYNIHLSINLTSFIFTGNTSIYVTASDDVTLNDHIILHAIGLDIHPQSVSVLEVFPIEQPVSVYNSSFSKFNEFYVIKLKDHVIESGNRYVLSFIGFTGLIGDDLKGLYRSSYRTSEGETRYLALTQLQSIDARRVYPCFDEPDMKAVFNVSVSHQESYTALSNMEDRLTERGTDGWMTVHFLPTPKMATYLLAVLVSDFTSESVVNDHGLLIRVWTRRDMEKQRRYALETIKKTFDYFADYFNCTEILSKSDHAAVPDFVAGAMENWGLVLYRETSMLFDPDSDSFKKNLLVSLIMAHEIAHSWFGNMATMAWWDDLWLNEGFANTLMFFPINEFHKDWKVFDDQLVSHIFPVMIRDSLNTSKALSTPIVHLDNITNNFDVISYDKGMAVLRMLHGFLSWETFRNGLRAYIKEFTFSNANITQIWDIFERSSNYSFKVKEILNTWTLQMGFPVVTVSQIGEGRFRLSQEKCQLSASDYYDVDSSPYGYKWIIPFTYVVEGDDEVKTKWMNMTSAELEIPKDKWLLGNVNCMGMFRVNYDIDMWGRLIAQLQHNHTVFSAATRAALINDAFNLARSGLLAYSKAFDLSTYLHMEEEFAPWKAFCDALDFIFSMLSHSDSFGQLKKFMRDLVERKFNAINSTAITDPTLINLKDLLFAWAIEVDVDKALDWAQDRFSVWMENQEKMPALHSSEVYNVGVRFGGEVVWDVVWNKTRSSLVAAETETLYSALAHTQESWLLWRYARRTLESDFIKVQDVGNIHNFFLATPLGQNVLLSFMITYWEEICKKFENDAFLLRDLITAAMRNVNTEYQYQQLSDLYTRKPPPGVVLTIFEDSLSLIRSNINWMVQSQSSISSWLTENIT